MTQDVDAALKSVQLSCTPSIGADRREQEEDFRSRLRRMTAQMRAQGLSAAKIAAEVRAMFYSNRDDGAWFIERRDGMGYAPNSAYPPVWALMEALALVIVIGRLILFQTAF